MGSETTLEIFIKMYNELLEDETASEWCAANFAEALGSLERGYYNADIKQIVAFLRLSYEHNRSHTQKILSKLKCNPNSEQYLKDFVYPLAKALKLALEEMSLTYKTVPFHGFALHFIVAAKSVLAKPSSKRRHNGEEQVTPEKFAEAFGDLQTVDEIIRTEAAMQID